MPSNCMSFLPEVGVVQRQGVGADEAVHPDILDFRDDMDTHSILSQHDPNRMKLTKKEYEDALEIKAMVEMSPDLDDLSDLMYAQLAIVCKDNVEDAIERCYGMKEFRQEYKIVDTYEQGEHYLKKIVQLFPEQFLSLSYSNDEGKYVFVHDVEKFDTKAFTSAELADDWLRMMYYNHILFFPDIESIRKGIIIAVDCKGMTMRRDMLKHCKTLFQEFLTYFPHSGQVRLFNAGTIMNVFASILRKLLPPEMKDQFIAGYQYEGGLARDFLSPTVEAANQRVLSRMQQSVKKRYENEKEFSLR